MGCKYYLPLADIFSNVLSKYESGLGFTAQRNFPFFFANACSNKILIHRGSKLSNKDFSDNNFGRHETSLYKRSDP